MNCLSVFIRQGLDTGFGGDDDAYNVYDKAWRREGSTANAIYRPSKNVDRDVYGDDLEKLVQSNRSIGNFPVAVSLILKARLIAKLFI